MKKSDFLSNAIGLTDFTRQTILQSESLEVSGLAQEAMKMTSATHQYAMLEARRAAETAKYAQQTVDILGTTHLHILEDFARQREWLTTAVAGLDLANINRAIGMTQSSHAWVDDILSDQHRFRDLLDGFAQDRYIASQFGGVRGLGLDLMTASHAAALNFQSASASMFDSSSFGTAAFEKIGAIGLGDYSKQLNSVLAGIDFDALKDIASMAGSVLLHDLVEEDSDTTDEPPTSARLDEAIERANLATVREAVREEIEKAVKKTIGDNPSIKFSPTLIYIYIPLLCMFLNTICGPLWSRWLAQQDAADAAKKASVTQVKTKTTTRFLDHLAVKGDALPLRMGPSTTERAIMVLARGQMVEVLKRKGLWARVRYIDPLHPGVEFTGWIKIKQTQRVEDETIRRIWCALTESVSRDADACEAD
jgi:Bacterial SH3 domain